MAGIEHMARRSYRRWQLNQQVAQRFWQDEQAAHVRPDVITVSRQVGSGGATVAKLVAKELGYALYDREVLEFMAEKLRAEARHLQRMEEKLPGWMDEIIHGALARVPSRAGYKRALVEVMHEIAARGKCIILGRAGAVILPQSLRVRIVAPFEVRVARVADLENLDPKKAEKQVAQIDGKRRRWAQRYFGATLEEPELYDLVINTQRTSLEHAAELVIAAVKQRLEAK